MPTKMMRDWTVEKRTGRKLVEEWVDSQESIAEAARILGLGCSSRQRLWAYLRVGTGLGDWDELRMAVITGIPYRAIVIADTPIRELFDPSLGEIYVGDTDCEARMKRQA